MLGYLKIDNLRGTVTDLHGPNVITRGVVDVDGLVGLAGARESVRPRSFRHGSRSRTKYLNDNVVTVTGEVWGSSHAAMYAELDAIEAALYDALDEDVHLLYRRGLDGPELRQVVRFASDGLKAKLAGNARVLSYQLTLRATEPRAFSQAVYTATSQPMGASGGGSTFPMTFPATFDPGSAGFAVVENQGSVATPPTFRLYGRLVNPTVRLVGPDIDLALAGTVAAGDYMELDASSDPRRVLLNGAANRLSLVDFSASRWFDLPRGRSTLRLLADDADADAYMTVTYRHAYGG